MKIARISSRFYLFESIEGGEKWARYSFLGFDPIMRIVGKNKKIVVTEKGVKKEVQSQDPAAEIRAILTKYKAPKLAGMPPFAGGLVGYFAYSMIGYTEPALNLKSSEFPDFDLMLFDKVIVYDHLKQKILIVVNMQTDEAEKIIKSPGNNRRN